MVNSQSKIVNQIASLVITIHLKKSNKKNRCSKLPAASQNGHLQLPVSSSEQNKRSQNLFQNPNLILSHGFFLHLKPHQLLILLPYRHTVNIFLTIFFKFLSAAFAILLIRPFCSQARPRISYLNSRYPLFLPPPGGIEEPSESVRPIALRPAAWQLKTWHAKLKTALPLRPAFWARPAIPPDLARFHRYPGILKLAAGAPVIPHARFRHKNVDFARIGRAQGRRRLRGLSDISRKKAQK